MPDKDKIHSSCTSRLYNAQHKATIPNNIGLACSSLSQEQLATLVPVPAPLRICHLFGLLAKAAFPSLVCVDNIHQVVFGDLINRIRVDSLHIMAAPTRFSSVT